MFDTLLRNIYYRLNALRYHCPSKRIYVNNTAKIKKNTYIEGPNKIGANSYISGTIGGYSYIGENCKLGKVSIGRFCSISPNVKVIAGDHPV